MSLTNREIYKMTDKSLKDFGNESYWADFKTEIGIASSYGFPPDLEQDAQNGDTRAQNNLGVLYYLGKHRNQDYKKAAYWFKEAAEKGYAISQYNLGFMYQKEKGFKEDGEQAFRWFMKAAEQGYAIAQYQASKYFTDSTGETCSKSYQKNWLKKAADSGNPLAQYELGIFSSEEILGKEIFGESNEPISQIQKKINWLVMSAIQGYAPAQIKLGNYYQYGYGLKQDNKKAVIWYFKAALQGYSRGQYYLGKCLYNGIGVQQNFEKALKWLHSAAIQEDINAQFDLGTYYLNTADKKDEKANLAEAAKWYLKAAEQGNVDALNQLIKLSEQDSEIYNNLIDAIPFFRKAAEQGNADAQYQLGLIYERGFGDELHYNFLEADTWIRKAAEQGNVNALYHLGQAFEQGETNQEIIKWYYEAAEHGHETACFVLGKAYLHGSCYNIKVSQDFNKAFKYLACASAIRKPQIIGELAVCYLCGLGVQRNLGIAKDIFQSLALKNEEIPPISIAAKMALAKMYLAGEGVNKNEGNVLFYLDSIKDFLPYINGSELYKFNGYLKLNDKDIFQWLEKKRAMGEGKSQSILELYSLSHHSYKSEHCHQLVENQGDVGANAFIPEKKHKNFHYSGY